MYIYDGLIPHVNFCQTLHGGVCEEPNNDSSLTEGEPRMTLWEDLEVPRYKTSHMADR